jgi:pumilio RNA-binding family
LLKEGCEVVRRIVFDGVMGALHFVMGSRAWRVVFVELLRAGSFDELKVIVNVACESGPPRSTSRMMHAGKFANESLH